MNRLLLTITVAALCVTLAPCRVMAQEITRLEVHISGGTVKTSLTLSLEESQIKLISEGLQKEIAFYIDIFRKWNLWPDEFIKGKKISRTLIANPVKGEYKVISIEGNTILEKRFNSFDSMIKWALNIKEATLVTDALSDDSSYFVRITVESVKQKPQQMLGYVFFFVDDRDFKIKKDSATFTPLVK
ncbi:DUF4390 domain-containing protein [Candidatus Magnetomonas plexicatena]|uniref:DUF4390 domain-containing protein n=1 Tax=Candidatus Magnetomonas plexicatena TaxID=2552947 RepID=UPI001C7800DF|nr:DUF4390 domain-containing protein [Nitrospirales bacterium LBB_01]